MSLAIRRTTADVPPATPAEPETASAATTHG
jgi:hypothetical protein